VELTCVPASKEHQGWLIVVGLKMRQA